MKIPSMTYPTRLALIAALVLCSLGSRAAHADQSQFVNARIETRTVSQRLAAAVSQIAAESQQPLWIAYEVEGLSGGHSSCCVEHQSETNRGACGVCNLEKQSGDVAINPSKNTTIKLEAPAQITMLLRADQKQVMRIRVVSSNCVLDAGGLRAVWLTGVKAEESVALLSRFADSSARGSEHGDGLRAQSIMAIAQHADRSADVALGTFVTPDKPAALREKAAFWLAAARGKTGLTLLEKMANSDPSPGMRGKVAFALFVSPEPHAVDDMIRMAKDDADSHVRGQALFWLGQKAGQKASGAITTAIQNDPDTEVKKKAVFALSQMPKDEGVPKLIEVAQSNRNSEVRKQAMFWLGQSQDPRALAFFEKILRP
jgi:HEAT repeat protein